MFISNIILKYIIRYLKILLTVSGIFKAGRKEIFLQLNLVCIRKTIFKFSSIIK